MTHDEINKALHEARGLCWHECEGGSVTLGTFPMEWTAACVHCDERQKGVIYNDMDPFICANEKAQYCNDLNAMAEVEAGFDLFERCDYLSVLDTLHDLVNLYDIITAPAHIRAKAALEVLTKGKSDE